MRTFLSPLRSRSWQAASVAMAVWLGGCGDSVLDYPNGKPTADAVADQISGSDVTPDTTPDTKTDVLPGTDVVGSDVVAPAVCGDGKIGGTEKCDDGKKVDGDGCSKDCAIEAGYTCANEPSVCSDINECNTGNGGCSAAGTCSNLPGSFECKCKPGYTGDGKTCTNINECTDNTDDCGTNATCTDTDGSFTCACNTGYIGDGKSCAEIVACEPGKFTCDPNATCNGTGPGTYDCICKAGYTGDGKTCTNIDECAENKDNCDMAADCTDTVGSFTCACKPGYSGNGVTCADINECTLDTDGCDLMADCTNTVGSFGCACKPGYSGDGFSCSDIDECATEGDNCDLAADCSNTVGSFVCDCNPGYSGDGVTCTDINECDTGADNCDLAADCSNTMGSFACACKAGYLGNGLVCEDINECADLTFTGDIASLPWEISNSTDIAGWKIADGALIYNNFGNTTGYGQGVANSGTARITIPVTGLDMNYRFGIEVVGLALIETPTSVDQLSGIFYINDFPIGELEKGDWYDPATGTIGFNEDGIELSDAPFDVTSVTFELRFDTVDGNENSNLGVIIQGFRFWQVSNVCSPDYFGKEQAACSNLPGSFQCLCPQGYAGDGITACNDVDECALNSDNCDLAADCTNVEGGFYCQCQPGYFGDGVTCEDYDECDMGWANCGLAADCSNTVGSYDCSCQEGYQGDGFNCQDVNECDLLGWAGPAMPSDLTWDITNTSDTVGWHFEEGSLYYSATATDSYDTPGQANAGKATISFDLSGLDRTQPLFFSASGLADIELDGGTAADFFQAKVYANGFLIQTITVDEIPIALSGEPTFTAVIDMAFLPLQFTQVTIEMEFDTVDGDANNTKGIRIDSIGFLQPVINCGEYAYCMNQVGSYSCECDKGYRDNGNGCENIDECVELAPCATEATCTDYDGYYDCACGKSGYQGNGYDSCDDINECDLGQYLCGTNETCLNLPGTATCTCSGGFEDLGAGCVDINECAPGGAGSFCSFIGFACDNFPGGYNCNPIGPQCNGFCEGPGDCPMDCTIGFCGNNFCEPGEEMFCPTDCFDAPTCGNNECDVPGDLIDCPAECDG